MEDKLIRGDFPSNSDREKKEIESKDKKIVPIVKGKVFKQPKSFGQKISETFFGDDTKSVAEYILHDVLIPAMKSTLSDMVGGGIEMLLFGERKYSRSSRNVYRDRDRSYIPYNRLSRTRRDDDVIDRRYMSRSARNRHDFDDIIIEDRGEAEDVLSRLVDVIDEYGLVSVGDYYDLVGIPSTFTDNNWGWDNVSQAFVERRREGYSIRLPRPKEIT